MQHDYISYVLLACNNLFSVQNVLKPPLARTSDIFFVLEPIPSINNTLSAPWNNQTYQKKYIYIVDITTNNIDKVEMFLTTPEPTLYSLAKKMI
jgi:hypothetical protein